MKIWSNYWEFAEKGKYLMGKISNQQLKKKKSLVTATQKNKKHDLNQFKMEQ